MGEWEWSLQQLAGMRSATATARRPLELPREPLIQRNYLLSDEASTQI